MLRLLGRKTSGNVQKVLWLLEELGTPYEREDYGRQFANTQDETYLKLNPNGKVPTLVDGDVVIWESNTILRYLDNKHGGSFHPSDAALRSQVERWMDWQLSALNPHYMAIFRESRKAPEDRSADLPEMAKEMDAQLKILDDALAGRDWLAGGEISLADIALGPIVNRCVNFPVELSALPNLRAWCDRIGKRDAFKTATG